MSKKKVVLAYSGGLDTSVAIKWLADKGYDVIAVGLDVGEGKDLAFIKEKALKVGAIQSYTIDAKKEYAEDFVLPALQAHALYEQKYPLVSALSRPLISKKLVEIAEQTGQMLLRMAVRVKGMIRFALKYRFKPLIQTWRFLLQCGNGLGPETKKFSMQKRTISRFQSIWITRIRLTKIYGGAATNVVFSRILGLLHLRGRMS